MALLSATDPTALVMHTALPVDRNPFTTIFAAVRRDLIHLMVDE
ncbi:MAG: hypothetical protein O3A51_11325 [Verrucomicrobia bacterium]|nr:hypothetical protein [Verrucomicrobiota bacterium]